MKGVPHVNFLKPHVKWATHVKPLDEIGNTKHNLDLPLIRDI